MKEVYSNILVPATTKSKFIRNKNIRLSTSETSLRLIIEIFGPNDGGRRNKNGFYTER